MKKKLLSLCKQKFILLFVSGLFMSFNVFPQTSGYVFKHALIGNASGEAFPIFKF